MKLDYAPPWFLDLRDQALAHPIRKLDGRDMARYTHDDGPWRVILCAVAEEEDYWCLRVGMHPVKGLPEPRERGETTSKMARYARALLKAANMGRGGYEESRFPDTCKVTLARQLTSSEAETMSEETSCQKKPLVDTIKVEAESAYCARYYMVWRGIGVEVHTSESTTTPKELRKQAIEEIERRAMNIMDWESPGSAAGSGES